LKLLRDNKALHQDEFSNVSPYVVMFGPDKCGSTNKVHFIVNHKNPKTGEYEEKHLSTAPAARIVKTTELYTLIVHPNNTVIIKLNGEQVKEANLLEDFQPPFNPPKEIDDPKDSKPDTWVDEARIADPEAKKPEGKLLVSSPSYFTTNSLQTGMRMRHSRLLMRRLPNLKTGSQMSLLPFLIQRRRCLKVR
jgi:calnexin